MSDITNVSMFMNMPEWQAKLLCYVVAVAVLGFSVACGGGDGAVAVTEGTSDSNGKVVLTIGGTDRTLYIVDENDHSQVIPNVTVKVDEEVSRLQIYAKDNGEGYYSQYLYLTPSDIETEQVLLMTPLPDNYQEL